MSNPLRTPENYEHFLYTIQEHFSIVQNSTLTFVRRGATIARVADELIFDFRLVIRERIIYQR